MVLVRSNPAVVNLDNPLQFKGEINANSDFPTSAEVQNGWFYTIGTDVTDNDGTKTNTDQSFIVGEEIAWNGTDWTVVGNAAHFLNDLRDVTITSPADNELLAYNLGTSTWINQTPTEAGFDSIYLKLDGSNANTTIDIGSENLTTIGTAFLGLIDLGTNTIDDTSMTGDWNFNASAFTGIASLDGAGTIDLEDNLDGTGFTITAGQIIDKGLTASKVVFTDGSKQLTSTAITSGDGVYWNRTGTVLSPVTAGDDITITGDINILSDSSKLRLGAASTDSSIWFDGSILNLLADGEAFFGTRGYGILGTTGIGGLGREQGEQNGAPGGDVTFVTGVGGAGGDWEQGGDGGSIFLTTGLGGAAGTGGEVGLRVPGAQGDICLQSRFIQFFSNNDTNDYITIWQPSANQPALSFVSANGYISTSETYIAIKDPVYIPGDSDAFASPTNVMLGAYVSGTSCFFEINAYSNTSGHQPAIVYRRARGTHASPTATQDNDALGALITGRGYDTGGVWRIAVNAGSRQDGAAGNGFVDGEIYFATRKNNVNTEWLNIRADGSIEMNNDNSALKFGATNTDLQLSSNGTQGFVSTNDDLYISCGTDKTLELQESVYKDINMAGYLLTKPASSAPGTVTFIDENGDDTTIETYGFAVGELVHGGFEIQHDYVEGTDLVFHVHWQGIAAPSGIDNVQWRLTYVVMRGNTTLNPAVTIDSSDTAIDTRYKSYRTSFGVIDGTNFLIEDQFMFTLTRVTATGDAYAGDALIETAGIHYEVNTLGSRQVATK